MGKMFEELDGYLFHNGTHYELYKKMGAHLTFEDGREGVHFVLWAPNAQAVCVLSDGNGWTPWRDNMTKTEYGVWELFLPGMNEGTRYKYRIKGADGLETDKTDPYGFSFELRPSNASVVADISKFEWSDGVWQKNKEKEKGKREFLKKPMAIYEVHLGSFKKDLSKNDEDRYFSYRALAHDLAEYVEYMGYTHIELMGICEYPFDLSWGYQVTGYFAPTARYGNPEDFMYFVNYMHERNIGVILDWVPAHFPKDSHSLGRFDGTPLYESADPLLAEYPEWGTYAFDHGKKEVSNFLLASALFWVNEYHIDALRVDAVAAMLYTSFSRPQWRPNKDGGTYNYESMEFIKHLNSVVEERTPAFLIAEDSSILEGMTKKTEKGGFGFGFKWDMGWMNETLRYLALDPVYRSYHHGLMTHTFDYVFEENYMLVLSHDEVVYGKGSMFRKIPGNIMEKFGCLKTFYTMMFGHPGKKLIFMGSDFGQYEEWDCKASLHWDQADGTGNRDLMNCLRRLLRIYKEREVLHNDSGKNTFEWIDSMDSARSIYSFIRRNPWNYDDALYFVCSYTPVDRPDYAMGVPEKGKYRRIFSTYPESEETVFEAEEVLCDGRNFRIPFDLRPYESAIFEKIPDENEKKSEAKSAAKKPSKASSKASAKASEKKPSKAPAKKKASAKTPEK